MSTTPSPGSVIRHQESRLLYLFTRTPLHVGAGASVGAIDQPIQRERHTGFPIVPGSTLKGVFADEWTVVVDQEEEDPGQPGRKRPVRKAEAKPERDWLFGKEAGSGELTAGALQFGEARLLAFPVRSARGSFAWITCPLILQRAVRDGVFDGTADEFHKARNKITQLSEPTDDEALFPTGKLDLEVRKDDQVVKQVVLEEYTFTRAGADEAAVVRAAFVKLIDDPVWQKVEDRLIIISNGMMSFFATAACEVAQHVTIDDTTGTAKDTGLFNQENVPSETLFYAVVRGLDERAKSKTELELRSAACAVGVLANRVREQGVFQFGADASTGLGYCTVRLATPAVPASAGVPPEQPGGSAEPANPLAPADQPTTNT